MARGITEKDVFTACDALVLAGERPTIERVRQKIGRGSPNTVSPMLDAWFRGLGRRLQDPGVFAPPSDVPEPVMQAAQHFWEVAQVNARVDLEAQVLERLAPMQAEVDRAQHAAAVATAEKEASDSKAREVQNQLADLTARLDAERTAHAGTAARVEAAQSRVDDLAARLMAIEAEAREIEERARSEVQAAHERATGAERRAALEIESERVARAKADKRTGGLEKRVENLQTTSVAQVEELVKARAELDHERREVQRLQRANDEESGQRQTAEGALIEAKLAIERAEAEARTTQDAMTRLLPLIGNAKQKRTPAKERTPAKSRRDPSGLVV